MSDMYDKIKDICLAVVCLLIACACFVGATTILSVAFCLIFNFSEPTTNAIIYCVIACSVIYFLLCTFKFIFNLSK